MIKQLSSYLYQNFYDKKFALYKKKYILQCLYATLVVYFVLTTISLISSNIVAASIASTSFLIFSAPHAERSKIRYIYGGYLVGFLIGMACYYCMLFFISHFPALHMHFDEVFGGLAVGLSIFLMVIIDVEHPPASAVSLAMVINNWNVWTIVVTFLALIILTLSRRLFRKYLIELV